MYVMNLCTYELCMGGLLGTAQQTWARGLELPRLGVSILDCLTSVCAKVGVRSPGQQEDMHTLCST